MRATHASPDLTNPSGIALLADLSQQFPLVARAVPVIVWALGLEAVFLTGRHIALGGAYGLDAHAYWLAAQGANPLVYSLPPGYPDAFLYSPAFLAAIRPLGILPWPAFYMVWLGILSATLLWLVKPAPAAWAAPLVLLCTPELLNGNIFILIAASAILALRYPSLWVFARLAQA